MMLFILCEFQIVSQFPPRPISILDKNTEVHDAYEREAVFEMFEARCLNQDLHRKLLAVSDITDIADIAVIVLEYEGSLTNSADGKAFIADYKARINSSNHNQVKGQHDLSRVVHLLGTHDSLIQNSSSASLKKT